MSVPRFGRLQKEIMRALADGARLYDEASSKKTSQGRRAVRRCYLETPEGQKEVHRVTVDKLVARGLLRYDGEKPKLDCWNLTTRRALVVLAD